MTSLELSDNNLGPGTASLAAGLQQLPNLKVLALNNCGLTSWPLAGLSPGCLQGLHTLELAGNSFGRSCPVDGLAACPRLKSLDLSGVYEGLSIGPTAAEPVRSNTTLLAASILHHARQECSMLAARRAV